MIVLWSGINIIIKELTQWHPWNGFILHYTWLMQKKHFPWYERFSPGISRTKRTIIGKWTQTHSKLHELRSIVSNTYQIFRLDRVREAVYEHFSQSPWIVFNTNDRSNVYALLECTRFFVKVGIEELPHRRIATSWTNARFEWILIYLALLLYL